MADAPFLSGSDFSKEKTYDVVIVGAGVAGSMIAKQLANQNKSVLVLEAGRATSIRPEGYASYVENFYTALAKVPNSPYPQNPNAPSTSVLDPTPRNPVTKDWVPGSSGYPVFLGPLPFFSDYLRQLGGTTLHFLGTCIRMIENDFCLQSRYGVGQDWPISAADLAPFYDQAETEIGVAADLDEQRSEGAVFTKDYEFPMLPIPPTYLDRWLRHHLRGLHVSMGHYKMPVKVRGTPAGRNGMPNPKWKPAPFEPRGAVYDPRTGERCEGNSACVPICPVMAKYNAMRTLFSLEGAQRKNLTVVTQAVASKIQLDPSRKRVTGIQFKRYDTETSTINVDEFVAKGRVYVIAAHAIETAKLLLASDAANSSDMVGRNLMDHPYLLTWGLAPEGAHLGVCRGPQITSEIPMRDGAFRKEVAAFRADIRNGGWDFAAGSPYTNVQTLTIGSKKQPGLFGAKLRDQLRDDVGRQISFGFQIEQLPDPDNRITISEEYKDALGNYRPVIRYDIDNYTRNGIRYAKALSDAVLEQVGGMDCTEPNPNSPGYIRIPGAKDKRGKPLYVTINGAGHIMGTHRMGSHRHTSVVNKDQRTWDHDNLYLVGCGNMPTVGSSNPTLTIAALAFQAAARIKQDLK